MLDRAVTYSLTEEHNATVTRKRPVSRKAVLRTAPLATWRYLATTPCSNCTNQITSFVNPALSPSSPSSSPSPPLSPPPPVCGTQTTVSLLGNRRTLDPANVHQRHRALSISSLRRSILLPSRLHRTCATRNLQIPNVPRSIGAQDLRLRTRCASVISAFRSSDSGILTQAFKSVITLVLCSC